MQVSQLFMPEIAEAIEKGDFESLRAVFEDLHPSDVAELLTHLTPESISRIIRILRAPNGIAVFEQLNIETQTQVLSHLGRHDTVMILEEMSPDDRVDLLQKLSPETVEALLPLMAQAERDDVRKLLQYGENTAGAIMTTEYASLPGSLPVSEALPKLRAIAPDSETIYYVYITDAERKLLGIASLREILVARPTQTIREVMAENVVRVTVDQDQEDVARAFQKYDLLAIPVVDKEGRLVGIVTHDDVLDVMVKEQTEDVQKMGAVEPITEPYFKASFWSLARKRGGWLMFLFLGELFTGTALRHYEETFAHTIALVLFVPLIVSSGGNSGSQSVTLITRALALGEVRMRDAFRVVRRELAMGVVLGIFLGVIGYLRAMMWHSPPSLALTVSVALVAVVVSGTLIGALLPMLFKKMGLDPAIMSSPFVASLVDVVGIVVYFKVAQILIM
jgi:magnesium transporter